MRWTPKLFRPIRGEGRGRRGRARRRQRQCLLHGCSVVPSVDDWPEMLGIMAGQKDSIPRNRCCARCWHWQWHVPGWFYRLCSSRCVLSSVGYGPEGQLRCFRAVFSLIVGSPVLLDIVGLLDRFVRCPLMQRQVSRSRKVLVYEFVQFLNKVGDVPASGGDAVAGHLHGGRLPCCGAEANPHGLLHSPHPTPPHLPPPPPPPPSWDRALNTSTTDMNSTSSC